MNGWNCMAGRVACVIALVAACAPSAEQRAEGERTSLRGAEEAFPGQIGEPQTGWFADENGELFELDYLSYDGRAVWQGDVMLPDPGQRSGVITAFGGRWPQGVVPVESSGLFSDSRVVAAIAHWESRTSLKFVFGATTGNRLQFVDGGDPNSCWSHIGMTGLGAQAVNLGTNCDTGTAIHEIGHAIGLFHEQSRTDRDAFVNINWGCILFPFAYNFYTYFPGSGQNVGPYDTSSVMHYDSMAFANPSCGPTITRKDGTSILAQSVLSGGDITGAQSLYQMWAPHRPVDYTGDGRADITVFRPSNGMWLMIDSGTDQISEVQWGAPNDVPVPGDYDADGVGDRAVWRPSSGEWYTQSSSNTGSWGAQWGTAGDVPVPGDYDGDGRTEYAVWRPSDKHWHFKTVDGASWSILWGEPGDVPVPGDYDGDGVDDIAVWRRSTGMWYIATSAGGVIERQWGAPSDVPVPGDYDGDGIDQIAVWRPATGEWIWLSEDRLSVFVKQWGTKSDTPVPGDYDGDGTLDPAVYRSSEGRWHVTTSYGPTSSRVWGFANDVAVP